MNKFIHSSINFLLKRFGLILQKSEDEWERGAFAKFYESSITHVAQSCGGYRLFKGQGFAASRASLFILGKSSFTSTASHPISRLNAIASEGVRGSHGNIFR